MTDLDEKTLSKALGFKMDPASLKDFLSSIKNDKLKNVYIIYIIKK